MERYRNISRKSGIASFEISADSITIRFTTGATYLYNYAATGERNIEQMKILARRGMGLNSFIGKVVKNKFAAKLR